jgi:hypothetical protein
MLGPLTQELVQTLCPPPHQPPVQKLLSERCSLTLPGVGTTPEWLGLIDRVQLATLRASHWDLATIEKAVNLANTDWRDVLVDAGFGHSVTAHIHWQRDALQTGDLT